MKFRYLLCSLFLAFGILHYPVVPVQAAQDMDMPKDERIYSYVTPFTVTHSFSDEHGTFRKETVSPVLHRLDGISAYSGNCIGKPDLDASFCRRNLEDSPAFSDDTARRIRSVVLASYPKREISEIQACANLWLQERELPELRDLQSGEAILAAQIAVWKLVGGEHYRVQELYSGARDLTQVRDLTVSQRELGQKQTPHTKENIKSLYTYFYNLDPTQPERLLISDSSIVRTVYSETKSKGTFTADLEVTVSAEIHPEDTLTLTVYWGEEMASQELTAAGVYKFSHIGNRRCPEVKLEITGYQKGGDVYLFEPEGEQSGFLLGWDEGKKSVQCERRWIPVT